MESMVESFWRNKKVLITGHTGFKGSWLSLWLSELGADLVGYALAPDTKPNLFELLHLEQRMQSVIADVRDAEKLKHVVMQYQPEIILHLAAQPLVRYSYQQPVETYQTNVMGTVNILEAIRNVDCVKALINVTTDKVYFNDEQGNAYTEMDKLGGYDPYSSSKACSELVTSAYRDSFLKDSVGVATARAGNVIGGGDWSVDRLIPDIIKHWSNGQMLNIRYPNAVRPWQHVLESLSGYLLLAENLYCEPKAFAQAWNFGPTPDEVASVADVVSYMADRWPGENHWQAEEQTQPHEAGLLTINSSLAINKLSWQPRWNVHQALDKVIEWYQVWLDKQNILELTIKQINDFQEKK